MERLKPGPKFERDAARAERAHTHKPNPAVDMHRPMVWPGKRFGSSVQMGEGHIRSEGHLRPKPPITFRGKPM